MSSSAENRLQEKIVDLEIRLTHQEDHILSLDKIVYEQDKLLSVLLEKVKQMDEKLKSSGENNILSADEETPPPHY
ncbi:MAG: SlyX family protein [Gammaproteobacteria bacterium]|nr:SlyX family protein [Gammaproteobacteria bacterium]